MFGHSATGQALYYLHSSFLEDSFLHLQVINYPLSALQELMESTKAQSLKFGQLNEYYLNLTFRLEGHHIEIGRDLLTVRLLVHFGMV